MRDNFKEYADTLIRNRISDRRSECSDMHSPDVRSRAQSQDKFYSKPLLRNTSSIEINHVEASTAENSKPKDSFIKQPVISPNLFKAVEQPKPEPVEASKEPSLFS
jgi:hypothetical protein